MKKQYIKAIVDLLLQGRDIDAVLSNLNKVLHKRGHERLHAQILKGIVTELKQQEKTLASSVVVANEADVESFKSTIADALQKLGGSMDQAHVTVDQTLIGGFIASNEGKLINRSYKEKLVSLYRSITK